MPNNPTCDSCGSVLKTEADAFVLTYCKTKIDKIEYETDVNFLNKIETKRICENCKKILDMCFFYREGIIKEVLKKLEEQYKLIKKGKK